MSTVEALREAEAMIDRLRSALEEEVQARRALAGALALDRTRADEQRARILDLSGRLAASMRREEALEDQLAQAESMNKFAVAEAEDAKAWMARIIATAGGEVRVPDALVAMRRYTLSREEEPATFETIWRAEVLS